ncbi:cs domain protein, partial [Cystoisospora suis]
TFLSPKKKKKKCLLLLLVFHLKERKKESLRLVFYGKGSEERGDEGEKKKKKYFFDFHLLRDIQPKTGFVQFGEGRIQLHVKKARQEPCWKSLISLHESTPPYLKKQFVDSDSELCHYARVVWRGKYFLEKKRKEGERFSPSSSSFLEESSSPSSYDNFHLHARPPEIKTDAWIRMIEGMRRHVKEKMEKEEENEQEERRIHTRKHERTERRDKKKKKEILHEDL